MDKNIRNEGSTPSPRSGESVCLITHQPLARNAIHLSCNHSYNYTPLCKELVIQRSRTKNLTCPYCGQSIHRYIPYIPELYDLRYKSIIRKSNCIDLRPCEYIYQRGPKKGTQCPCKSAYETDNGSFCFKHDKLRSSKLRNMPGLQ